MCKARPAGHVFLYYFLGRRGPGLGIGWVVYGGESGPGYRAEGEPDDPKAWARSMRDQCIGAGVPFFHKQSAAPKTERGVELDGTLWHQMPQPALGIEQYQQFGARVLDHSTAP
jgi:hypothetical protein